MTKFMINNRTYAWKTKINFVTSALSSFFKAWVLSQATFAVMASKHVGWIFNENSVYFEDIISSLTPWRHLEYRKAKYNSFGLQSFVKKWFSRWLQMS